MAIHDRWYKDERGDDGGRTGKQARTADYGCTKRWQVRWRDETGRQRKLAFARKADAERTDKTIQAQLVAGTYVDPTAGDVTFRAYAEEWRRTRMHDIATAELIESNLRLHAYPADRTPGRTKGGGPSVGDYPLRSLAKRPTLLQAWIKGLALGPNTARLVIGYVSQVFSAAVDDGLIPRNPLSARSIQRPAAVKVEAVPWTADQIDAVAEKLPARYAAYPDFAVTCGARQSELFAVAVEDIDWFRKTAAIGWQVKFAGGVLYYSPPKNKKPHVVPLADLVVLQLSEHVRLFPPVAVMLPSARPDGPPLTRMLIFSPGTGLPLKTGDFNYFWRRAWKAAGIPDRGRKNGNHVTRHTFASRLLSNGLSLAKVAALLGDTQQVVLSTYSHFMPDDDDRARDIMNAFFAVPESPAEAAQADADG
jgi:integrase